MHPNPAVHRDQIYQKEIHISWKKPENGSKIVILNLTEGDFYSLENPVSIDIWEQLMGGQTPGAILDGLARSYPTEDPAVLAQHLDEFLQELVGNRLICACLPSGG